jgi:hypothetical protein
MASLSVPNCTDGRDNDCDGFVDCDDWDCNWSPHTQAMCTARRQTGFCGPLSQRIRRLANGACDTSADPCAAPTDRASCEAAGCGWRSDLPLVCGPAPRREMPNDAGVDAP